ncbi:MAG: hypothetical protein M5R36_06675 [Deltaproteobacteria bacterium]|nr:hypothetical protein [Deltaproteobacteria bacterium]
MFGWIVKIAIVVVALLVVDRLLLALEKRGLIYWRKRKASPGTVGNALLELQSMLEPSKKHVVEQRKNEQTEKEAEGDPPEPNEVP